MMLDAIVTNTRAEVAERKARVKIEEIRTQIESAPPPRDFAKALRRENVALISEIKRASPSRGILRDDLIPEQLARSYEVNGASAISVLTDSKFFKGSLDDLRAVRGAVDIPILRKDFIIDEYQIFEARAVGADAFLLIARILSDSQMRDFLAVGKSLGMAALVEVHSEEELARALELPAELIGINNRNLDDFTISLTMTEKLAPKIPPNRTVVAESGIFTVADVERVSKVGVSAILVGEGLVRANSVESRVSELSSVRRLAL